MSKTAQNELLSCINKIIQCEIIKEKYNQGIGSLYGLEADEVRDKSNWEQLGIVIRYTKELIFVERLIHISQMSH